MALLRRARYAGADETYGERRGFAARASVARVVTLIGSIVAGILVAGILLIVLDANPANDIVNWVTDAARWLAGPFHDLFKLDNPEVRVAVNWGIAAVVYMVIARLIARLLLR
jgi:hypothetical protein